MKNSELFLVTNKDIIQQELSIDAIDKNKSNKILN